MEYFNENEYKDWKLDPEHCSPEFPCEDNDKFLMKGDERVRIGFYEEGIQLRKRKANSPYEIITGFSNKTRRLLIQGKEFYQMNIGIDKVYNENGECIKEIDWDKPYKFSIKDLIEKIQKEYHINLENKREGASVRRFEYEKLDNKPFYEVSIKSKENELKRDYILIDGKTGKTLFESFYYMKDENGKDPFDKYLESLKNK